MTELRFTIVRKADLDQHQLNVLDQATAAARSEPGPSGAWDDPVCFDKLRAIVLKTTNIPIGLLHVGGPPWASDVGWWIRSEYRGHRYCSEALALLADMLKAEGATGLTHILILDVDYGRSLHLLEEFAIRFNTAGVGLRPAVILGKRFAPLYEGSERSQHISRHCTPLLMPNVFKHSFSALTCRWANRGKAYINESGVQRNVRQ